MDMNNVNIEEIVKQVLSGMTLLCQSLKGNGRGSR